MGSATTVGTCRAIRKCASRRRPTAVRWAAQKPHLLGCWAEHLCLLPGSELIRLPDALSDDLAVLTEPFGVAVGLVERYQRAHEWITGDGFGLQRTVVIYGAGAIGILAAAAFSLAGARQVVMVDVDDERLALSRKFGVTHTFNAVSSPPTPEALRAMTDGLGVDIVVEACGVPRVIGQALSLLRRGGTLFEVGHLANVGLAEIDPHAVCRNELEILGHYAYPTSQTLAYATTLWRRMPSLTKRSSALHWTITRQCSTTRAAKFR